MTWDAIGWGLFMGMFKFMFAASFLEYYYTSLTVFEVFAISVTGAMICFNLTFWSAEYLMSRAKAKRIKAMQLGRQKRKKSFTRINKMIVRIKMSKFGFFTLCTVGVLIMSIPVSGIVVAKFYGENKKGYFLSLTTILITGFLLAFFNNFIFGLFK